jgi:hypothetical protein
VEITDQNVFRLLYFFDRWPNQNQIINIHKQNRALSVEHTRFIFALPVIVQFKSTCFNLLFHSLGACLIRRVFRNKQTLSDPSSNIGCLMYQIDSHVEKHCLRLDFRFRNFSAAIDNTKRTVSYRTGENNSLKSIPSTCLKPLATSRALFLLTVIALAFSRVRFISQQLHFAGSC